MSKNHNNSLNTFTALLMRYCLSFIKIFSLLWLSWSWALTTYASFQALTGGSKRKNVRLGMQRLVFLKTICLGLVLSLISPIASAVNASATPNLSCLKARVSNVNCTANDFTVGATFSAAPGTPPFCVAGSSFEFLVDLDITSNSPDRYDVGFFVGQSGVSPADLATNDCSVAIFPETPSPWVRLRKNTNTTNVCGDYLGPGQSTTNRIDKIKVNCQGTATGSLTIPYVLVYSQSNDDVCTGPGDVKPGTSSKCQQQDAAPVSGTVSVNVGTYLDVTKQTNPDGSSQTFSYTATGPVGSKVIALTGATLTPTSATGGTYTPTSIALASNTTTVSISDGQTVRFYMTGLATSQALKVTESLATGWEPTPSISCAAVTGAPTFTTPTSPTTPAVDIPRTRIVNLSATNSAAACTFTNTKRPTLTLTKISQGGTGTFTFTGDNGWASQGITTAAAGGSGTAGALQTLTTSSTATTITEALAAGYTMTGVSCTGMGAGGTVTPNLSAGTFTLDAAATAAGSDIACTVTNAKTPTVKIQKTTVGGVGGPFSFAQTNLASTPSSITTTAASTATPTTPTAINVTTIGTAVTLTETPAAGFLISTATCTDANSAITGNTGSAFATLAGNVLTIPALNVKAGADFTCVFTNVRRPTVTITKISNGGVGGFSFTGSNGFANQTITTASSGVGVAGATQTLTNESTSTTITETVPYGYALTNVACTGLGTGTATVNYTTATVTLDTNATAAANNIACTFTNTAYGTTPSDPLLKTTRFSAVPDIPTIVRGFSGTQNIVVTNHGPDNATNVVTYYRPLVATGVTVTAVSSPAGACVFSSPDWVCPAIASVLNGASYNITVTYSTTSASSLGIAKQGEIRVNSNEYTECGGVNEYKYNVWGLGGTSQPQPAPTNSAFWVGNTNTTTTATPSGAYSTESTDIFQAWPTTQDYPTGSYLYSPVAGQANNVYSPSSTTPNPTVSKVLTGLNGQPENNVLLPQFGSTGTFTGDNKRAWEGQTCIYVPVATTITPCLMMFDDAAYVSVKNLSTGVTTVAAGQSSWNPGAVLSGNVSASPGYYIIKARISNRNTNGSNSEDAQGGYGQLAGIGSATCSTAALDTLAQNAVPESINIIAPTTLQIAKAWGANSSASDSAIIGATTGGANNTTSFTTAGGTGANSGAAVAVTVGNTITFPAETGTNIANYNTVLSCTADGGATANALSGTNGQVSNTLVIGAGDLSKAIVCTYTNTRKSATLRIAKAWGANSITGNVANIGVTTGLTNNTSALTSTASTNINGTAVTVFAGEVATLPAETMSTGSLANYNTVLSCDNGITPSGSNGQASNTVTIPNTVSGLITCTYTNTRKSATLRIAKAWGANSITGNVANIGVTTGLTNNTSALTSTASTNTNGTAVTVFAGETVTLPAETMSTGTLSNYNTVLSCTADAGATANSLSGTNGQSSNTLTIGAGDEGKVVTCTYTNTRRTQSLTLAKQWTNAASGHTATVTTTGGTNNATFNSTSTGNNLTTGTAVTVYAGDVVTLPAETFGGGASAANYNTTLACTGGSTLASGAVGRTVTISNSATATTCTYTNSRKSATLTLRKTWVNAQLNNAVNVTATGLTSLASVANTASETDTGAAQTVYAGDAITLGETFTTGSSANYNSVLSCTGNATALAGNVLTINAADTAITCTQTNTRKSATLTLAKTWVNGVDGETATVTSSGFVNNASTGVSTSTGNNTTTGGSTSSTVFAGEVGTISEVLTNAANYDATLACTGTSGLSGTTLTIGPTDTSITCTQTNTRKSATLTLRKVWVNAKLNDALSVTATGLTSFSSVANTANETDTAAPQTVYVTDEITLGETFTTGSSANYTSVLSCTGNTTPLSGNVLTINNADTAIVCTQTNTRITQSLTLAKQWTNAASGHTATVTTTGGTNNATVNSTSTGNNLTTGTAVTVYAGDAVTLPAETFGGGASAANYTTTLACTGGSTLASGAVGRTVTITNSATATTCTYTNSRIAQNIRIAKQWTNAVSGHTATVTMTGGTNNATVNSTSTGNNLTTGTAVTVYAGDVVTLPAETFGGGASAANYTTSLACTGGSTLASGAVGRTLTISNSATLTTCTYTNSRIAQNLTIAKQWTNAASGHTATVTTTGGTNNATFNSTSTGNNLTTGTAVTVYAGDVVTLPAETFGGGASAANYNTTLACTGGSTLASGAVGRTVTISNSGTATTCTYTNTGLSDMVPSLTYMPNTGIVGSPYYGKFSCTNSGVAPATAGATCAITLPAGLSATCSPTVPTASTVAVNATINCTVTGTPTSAGSSTLVLTTGATNDSNGGTTNGGNNQVTQPITITDPTATAMCSSGSATNLLSAAGTELYYADNTNTPITNSFGLIASPATYVRTGSNFVVKGNWRWRNANPASGSPVMTYQLIVNGTAYAQLVGTPSGQEVGTLTALNGATLDGGLSTMQLYDFSVSGLAALPVSVTLPSTVTTISTLSMSFVSSTTPADDAGLAPTLLNACALPKLTITKVSNGGVGGFAFTGNNGFTNETITTTVAGTGVVGTTQTLSAVSTTTIISETIPSGYTVTDISCTGLGSGSATPNLATGTVTLSDTAVVYGANLACTFTNTATITNYILSGKVFLDNGKNAAIPHNGVLEADETGLGNITVQLTDCAATVHQSAVTNGAGAYSLAIPNGLLAGATVCVVEQPSSNLISVSGVAGNTGGTYSLAQDRTQFTLSAATNYTGVDFGNVVDSQLTSTGSQTIAAGTTASYSHQFISGTEGLVTFSTAQAPTPALTWTSLVYIDTNCNALLDGGDTQVTASVAVVADQVLCLLQKVQSPSTAANGSQDVSTISASFAFSAPSAITRLYNQDDTTIIMDSGLVLVKKVRSVSSCPSTGADVNPFVTNNQALPNSLIEYQITYSNPSSGVVSDVVINDMTPAFTTFRSASCASTPSSVLCSVGTSPTLGATGSISWPLANNPTGLTSGQSGDVRFCVQVDQ